MALIPEPGPRQQVNKDRKVLGKIRLYWFAAPTGSSFFSVMFSVRVE